MIRLNLTRERVDAIEEDASVNFREVLGLDSPRDSDNLSGSVALSEYVGGGKYFLEPSLFLLCHTTKYTS